MVLPRLIHPVNVTVEQIDRGATIYDPDAREPIQQAARSTAWTAPAQVQFTPSPSGAGTAQSLIVRDEGPSELTVGYALFRKYDLDNHSTGVKTIKIGDRLLNDGHLVGEFYVVRIQPMGHYPDQNGPTLLRAWFTDRKPAKERP